MNKIFFWLLLIPVQAWAVGGSFDAANNITGQGDSVYLKLAADNDPLTGTLSGTSAIFSGAVTASSVTAGTSGYRTGTANGVTVAACLATQALGSIKVDGGIVTAGSCVSLSTETAVNVVAPNFTATSSMTIVGNAFSVGDSTFNVKSGVVKIVTDSVADGLFYRRNSISAGTQARLNFGNSTADSISAFIASERVASGTDASLVLAPGQIEAMRLTASGAVTIPGNSFSVGVSTLVVKEGKVGIGTTAPGTALEIGTTGRLTFGRAAKATIIAIDPIVSGEVMYCTDCVAATLCISTGTAATQWSDIGDRTVACN